MISNESYFYNNASFELVELAKKGKTKELTEKVQELVQNGVTKNTFSVIDTSAQTRHLRERTFERLGLSNEKDFLTKSIREVNSLMDATVKNLHSKVKDPQKESAPLDAPKAKLPEKIRFQAKDGTLVVSSEYLLKKFEAYEKTYKEKFSHTNIFQPLLENSLHDSDIPLFDQLPKRLIRKFLTALEGPSALEALNIKKADLIALSNFSHKFGFGELANHLNLMIVKKAEEGNFKDFETLVNSLHKKPLSNKPLEKALDEAYLKKGVSEIKFGLSNLEKKSDPSLRALMVDAFSSLLESSSAKRNPKYLEKEFPTLVSKFASACSLEELVEINEALEENQETLKAFFTETCEKAEWVKETWTFLDPPNFTLEILSRDLSADLVTFLKENKQFAMNIARTQKESLAFVSQPLREDPEVYLPALKTDPGNLKYVSDQLKDDEALILSLVSIRGKGAALEQVLEHMSPRLKANEKILLTAFKNGGSSGWNHIHDSLKNDQKFMLKAIGAHLHMINFFPQYANDEKFMLEAIKIKYGTFPYAGENLKNDKQFLLKAIALDPKVMQFIPDEIKYDQAFFVEILKANKEAFFDVDKELLAKLKKAAGIA